MSHKRLCYSCDLKDDSKLIEEYKAYHAAGKAWPEITKSITDAGIVDMEIYLVGNRMFMIMKVDENKKCFDQRCTTDKIMTKNHWLHILFEMI